MGFRGPLEDRLAIRELIDAYADATMLRDAQAWGGLWAEDAVWGYEDYDPNLVEVHVSALRRKLEAHGPRLLHTVRGLGYVLRAGEP